MDMQGVGRKICELRKQLDMTQMELADRLYVSYQAVSSWERGLTMPDIAKLPDISQVLRVSIDELMQNEKQARLVKRILNDTAGVGYGIGSGVRADENRPELADIEELAPILKPKQVDALALKVGEAVSLGELCGIAPFVSREVLNGLALKVGEVESLGELCGIASFVSREVLNGLALKVGEAVSLGELCGIAPFVSKDVLNELVMRAAEGGSAVEPDERQ